MKIDTDGSSGLETRFSAPRDLAAALGGAAVLLLQGLKPANASDIGKWGIALRIATTSKDNVEIVAPILIE
ncbi:hypothetical protein V1281_005403 [Nitrobacteraceae bacterium AZCC 2161]